MKDAFLKVSYFPGMFSDEYEIDFHGAEKENNYGIWIMKEMLTPVSGTAGLAKVLIASEREKDSSILIRGAGESSGEFFSVPNEVLFQSIESGKKYISENNQ